MRLLSFSGKARHGKDTCAKIAQEIATNEFGQNLGMWAQATPLKARVYAALWEQYDIDDILIRKPPEVRKTLQWEGTEGGRQKFGEEVWTAQCEFFLRQFEDGFPFMQGVILPDVRFPNEVRFTRLGGRLAPKVMNRIAAEVDKRYAADTAALEGQMGLFDEIRTDTIRMLFEQEMEKSPGLALYIVSDRPTLEGEYAKHESEIALDGVDKNTFFDGIIYNNQTTTLEELQEQIRPWVGKLLSMS